MFHGPTSLLISDGYPQLRWQKCHQKFRSLPLVPTKGTLRVGSISVTKLCHPVAQELGAISVKRDNGDNNLNGNNSANGHDDADGYNRASVDNSTNCDKCTEPMTTIELMKKTYPMAAIKPMGKKLQWQQ